MKKIKTDLLSYGMSGKYFHAPFINLHQGFKLIGAWERSKKNIQKDYPAVKSYDTIEGLLAGDAELVIVNTPVETHYQYAKQVLLAGKHALVEKAFTATAAQAEELKAIADEKNLKLCVYQNRRWDSDFRTVKSVLEQNILGDIIEAEIHFDRYNPLLSPKAHKEVATPGAGVLWDLGSHIIDQAVQLFGMPHSVFADLRKTRQNSLIDDWFDIVLYYDSLRVRLKAGLFMREPVPSYIIHGTKGSFLKHRGDVQEDELKLGKNPTDTDWGTEPEALAGIIHTEKNGEVIKATVQTLQGNFTELFDGLYIAITENREVPVPAADGIKTMKIIDAALASSAQRKIIAL